MNIRKWEKNYRILLLIWYGSRNCHQDSSYAANATSVKYTQVQTAQIHFVSRKHGMIFFCKNLENSKYFIATNSMQRRTPWEANGGSSTQEILRNL